MKRSMSALVILILVAFITGCANQSVVVKDGTTLGLQFAGVTLSEQDQALQKRPSDQIKPLIVADSGWSYGTYNTIPGAVIIENPNEDWQCVRPLVTVISKDKDGNVLEYFSEEPMVVPPSSRVVIRLQSGGITGDIDHQDITIETVPSDWINTSLLPEHPYKLADLAFVPGQQNAITGTVEQTKAIELEEPVGSIWVVAVGYDQYGNIVDSGMSMLLNPELNKVEPFEIPLDQKDGVVEYVVYAQPGIYSEG